MSDQFIEVGNPEPEYESSKSWTHSERNARAAICSFITSEHLPFVSD